MNRCINASWRAKQLRIESLESRRVLATIFVDAAADPGGDGSEATPFNMIQDAVDAAVAAAGADTITLAQGDYVENVEIDEAGDLAILGNGSTLTSAGNDSRTMDIDDSGHIAIHDLTITGASGDGLRVRDSDSLILDNVKVNGNGDEGLQTDEVSTVILRNVKANANGDRGIQVDEADEVEISFVVANDNSGDGLKIEVANEVLIENSHFLRNDDGVDLEIIGSVDVQKMVANGNDNEGLEVDDVNSISVSDSVFKNNREAGLDIDDANMISVDHVTATHNGKHGLQIESQDDGDEFTTISSVVIVDSVFSNNVGDGIQIVEEEEDDGDDVMIADVAITNVRASANREIDDEDGGHGLFIEISGLLSLEKVVTKNNPRGNVIP